MADRDLIGKRCLAALFVAGDSYSCVLHDRHIGVHIYMKDEAKAPALVTEEMMHNTRSSEMVADHAWYFTLRDGNRLVEAAIRRAVGERTDTGGAVRIGVLHGATYLPGSAVLEFFGLTR